MQRIRNRQEAYDGLFVKPQAISHRSDKELEVEKKMLSEFKAFFTETEDARVNFDKEREARKREEYYSRVMRQQTRRQELEAMMALNDAGEILEQELYQGQNAEMAYFQSFQSRLRIEFSQREKPLRNAAGDSESDSLSSDSDPDAATETESEDDEEYLSDDD